MKSNYIHTCTYIYILGHNKTYIVYAVKEFASFRGAQSINGRGV